MRRVTVIVVGALLVASLLTGCRPPGSGRPTVVTSFYPLYFLADDIAGRYNDVVDLTPPGVEPHEYELTVRQVAQIDEARLGFFEKGMAPSIDQAMANDSPDHQLDVTSVVHLQSPSADYSEERVSDLDPHFWQDPSLMATAARAFASAIAEADPTHAAYYRMRGERLAARLDRLDRAYARSLATCRVRTLVVSHDAFEYLGRRYHLDIVPIAGLEPDSEPSLQHLHDLAGLIQERHVTTVFFETLASPALARSLAGDLHIRTGVLDPIEGLTSVDSHATYLTLMRQNLAAIAHANGCTS
ncbi:MAG: metal ABC transporter substrate-binding protein [Nocardioides sp.]